MSESTTLIREISGLRSDIGLDNLRSEMYGQLVIAYVNDLERLYRNIYAESQVDQFAKKATELLPDTQRYIAMRDFYLGGLVGLRAVDLGSHNGLVRTASDYVDQRTSVLQVSVNQVAEKRRDIVITCIDRGQTLAAQIDLPLDDWSAIATNMKQPNQNFKGGFLCSLGWGEYAANSRARFVTNKIFNEIIG